MGEPDLRRKFEKRVIQIESKTIFKVEIKGGGAQPVFLDFTLFRAHFDGRFNSGDHVHPGIVPSLRFVFEHDRQLNETEGRLLQFGHHRIVLIAEIHEALVKGNGGQNPGIQKFKKANVQNKPGRESKGSPGVDGGQLLVWPQGRIGQLLVKKRRGVCPKSGAVDGKKKSVMEEPVVVRNQILAFSLYGFRIVSRFPELGLGLTKCRSGHQTESGEKKKKDVRKAVGLHRLR
jgi:hypothetical protein